MAYTSDQLLELLVTGQSDWDTLINANMAVLNRGHQVVLTAGSTVASGQICAVLSGGLAWPTNARSESLVSRLISYRGVNSGESAQFIARGIVRSMSVWSGKIIPGEPVFVSAQSAGFAVSSYPGHGQAVGWSIANDAIMFNAGAAPVFPGLVTEVATLGPVVVGSQGDFLLTLGNRGVVRDLSVVTSHSRYKVRFWSGSSRVASELLYETLTRSLSTLSGDVNSTFFRDNAMFGYRGTDVNTPWAIFGRVDAQSMSLVTSAYINVTVVAERFR